MKRVERMRRLIEAQKTGTPEELAELLGISRRTVFVDLNELRDEGLNITYSRKKRTYIID
jgi:biotin operon repressor